MRVGNLRGSSALAYEADIVLILDTKSDIVARHHLMYGLGQRRAVQGLGGAVPSRRTAPAAAARSWSSRSASTRAASTRRPSVTEQLVDERVYVE